MKIPRISFCIVTLIVVAFHLASVPRAHADMDAAGTKDMLTSAPWKFAFDKGWSIVRTFNKDGTFMTPNRPDETGRWKFSGNTLVQTYADGRQDVLMMPLDPKGTTGVAKDGEAIAATQDNSAPGNGMLAPPSTPAAEMSEQDKAATGALLTSAPWKIAGMGWADVRTFMKDGTFTTVGQSDLHGRWKIGGNVITLIFANGHKDLILLPLDPKGTEGSDENGKPTTATLLSPAVAAGTPAPAATPAASLPVSAPMDDTMDEQQRDAAKALLVSGPWKVSGGGWSDVRIFDKNGTFTTAGHADLHGRWRISRNTIVLTFADEHKDTISLPLNPKGTLGTDRNGSATTAVLQGSGAP